MDSEGSALLASMIFNFSEHKETRHAIFASVQQLSHFLVRNTYSLKKLFSVLISHLFSRIYGIPYTISMFNIQYSHVPRSISSHNVQLICSQIHSSWLERYEKLRTAKRSYRHARLHRQAGRNDNPMPDSTLSPHSGTMNLAVMVWETWSASP